MQEIQILREIKLEITLGFPSNSSRREQCPFVKMAKLLAQCSFLFSDSAFRAGQSPRSQPHSYEVNESSFKKYAILLFLVLSLPL